MATVFQKNFVSNSYGVALRVKCRRRLGKRAISCGRLLFTVVEILHPASEVVGAGRR